VVATEAAASFILLPLELSRIVSADHDCTWLTAVIVLTLFVLTIAPTEVSHEAMATVYFTLEILIFMTVSIGTYNTTFVLHSH
jgi:hypothetical protein